MRASERVGRWAGVALAPMVAAGSRLRKARLFHPKGLLLRALVEPVGEPGTWRLAGQRLAGEAVVRLSSAWWSGKEWPDNLGCAVRFVGPDSSGPTQDVLFATIRSPWTTLLAPLTTDVHDFLANDYHGVSPFEVEGLGRVRLRLRTRQSGSIRNGERGGSRRERLESALGHGEGGFTLEARPLGDGHWSPIATILLLEFLPEERPDLAFDPFLDGRGVRPSGLIHSMRLAAYGASRRARRAAPPGAVPPDQGAQGGT